MAASVWRGGKEELDFSEGRGLSAETPVVIDSAGKLAMLSELTAGGNSFRGIYFLLTTDIDLNKRVWEPIGGPAAPFEGIFEGGGHTVGGLYVYDSEYAGLFGNLESYAVIGGLRVEGNIYASGASGQCFAGGVAGLCAGMISGCYYHGTIDVSALGSCYAGGLVGGLSGSVRGSIAYAAVLVGRNGAGTGKAGGIAGYSIGTVENCRSDGQISVLAAEQALAGGVVGDAYSGGITGCSSRPVIYAEAAESRAGGVVGCLQAGRLDGCYNLRSVEAASPAGNAFAGGAAGEARSAVVNCVNEGDVTGTSGAGGMIGVSDASGSAVNCRNSGGVSSPLAAGGIAADGAGLLDNCYNRGSVTGARSDGVTPGAGAVNACWSISSAPTAAGGSFERNGSAELAGRLNARAEELGPQIRRWTVNDRKNAGFPVFSEELLLTASSRGGGSISPEGTLGASGGDTVTFLIEPDAGCEIADVIVDGRSLGQIHSYTFRSLLTGHTVEAVFRTIGEKTATIVSRAGEGGSISPDGFTEVAFGRSAEYEIYPAEGYETAAVLVDGEDVGPVRDYVFSSVNGPHTIEAVFSPLPEGESVSPSGRHTITAVSGEGGSVSLEGEISVSDGESLTLEITPERGWHIQSVLVDGEDIGPAERYTFRDISGDHTLTVSFDIDGAGGEPGTEYFISEGPPVRNTGRIGAAVAGGMFGTSAAVAAAAAAVRALRRRKKLRRDQKEAE